MQTTNRYVQEACSSFGLHILLTETNGMRNEYYDMIEKARCLNHHPFGLDLPKPSNHWRDRKLLLGRPGTTDISVSSMCICLLHVITKIASGNMKIGKLREIQVGSANNHHIFFEAWTPLGVFIVGGCTDCSGEGGSGTHKLRSVFQLLCQIYNTKVEVVEISKSMLLAEFGEEHCLSLFIHPDVQKTG